MKKIGLLGGTSYPSTILYYKLLNELYNAKLGGFHSCPMIIKNIDYHQIKSRYNINNGWDEIPSLLEEEIQQLIALDPSCLIICNNTLHKAFDIVKSKLQLGIPIFHILELTASYIKEHNFAKILLLGTKFTMQNDFFKGFLINDGINVVVPNEFEMDEIQVIQTNLSKGKMNDDYKSYFSNLSTRYEDCDGIILGCTELPLVFDSIITKARKINPIELQCKKAISFITE